MSQRTTPPFRADMVGSLLRPTPLKDARAKFAKGEIDAAALKAVEDREIEKIIKKQAEVGLKLATDGEFRRSWWHFDFFRGLKGITPITTSTGIKFHGVETKHEAIRIDGKVDFAGHPMIEHFKFLKAHCNVTPKMCIPAHKNAWPRLAPSTATPAAAPPRSSWPACTVLRPAPPVRPSPRRSAMPYSQRSACSRP